jgi:hypothetical protein
MLDLSQASWEVPCPSCQQPVTVSLGDIQAGKVVACPSGHRFQLTSDPASLRDVQAAQDRLNKQLGDLKRQLGG